MNAFAAKYSDLSGPLNPNGVWTPAYIRFKQTVENNDAPDNILQALYDWLGTRNIKPGVVERLLHMPNAEDAYNGLVALIWGKRKPAEVRRDVQAIMRKSQAANTPIPYDEINAAHAKPKDVDISQDVRATLRKAIGQLAANYTSREGKKLDDQRGALDAMRKRFTPESVVEKLLSS